LPPPSSEAARDGPDVVAPGLLPTGSTMNVVAAIPEPLPQNAAAGSPAAAGETGGEAGAAGFGNVLLGLSGGAVPEHPANGGEGGEPKAETGDSDTALALVAALAAAAVAAVASAVPGVGAPAKAAESVAVTGGVPAAAAPVASPVVGGATQLLPELGGAAAAQAPASQPAPAGAGTSQATATDTAAATVTAEAEEPEEPAEVVEGSHAPVAPGANLQDGPPVVPTQTEKDAGEREPGRRETNGGVVVTGSRGLGHGETPEAKRTGGGGPSGPSPLSPAHPSDSSTPASSAGASAEDGDPSDGQPAADDGPTIIRSAHQERAAHAANVAEKAPPTVETKATDKATPHGVDTEAARPSAPVTSPGGALHTAAAETKTGGTDTPPPPALPPVPRPPAAVEPLPPAPVAARDVERFLRLGQLRPVGEDGGEMRLQLVPEGLGQVDVKIVVHADTVQATLYAQHDHARQALEAHRPSLEAALGRANLRLEGFTVGLGQHQQGPQGEQADARRLATGPAPAPVPIALPPSGQEPVAMASGLSVRA
jgi:hypothetical protein